MMMNVLASELDITPEALEKLRGRCIQEVKRTGGGITFKDAVTLSGRLYVVCVLVQALAQRKLTHQFFNHVDLLFSRRQVHVTGSKDPLVLSKVQEEVANHPGTVWLPIISLRREDAARLGFDTHAPIFQPC